MAFTAAEAYGRFMGRFSEPLAPLFAGWSAIRPGQRVLDVGCGPGVLTAELVARLGARSVAAIDPSAPFVEATRQRCPGVDVRQGGAEQLPFAAGTFDAALAQLVVHFLTDPVAGLTEMALVTRPGGTVAACVWDHAGGQGPLSLFWRAAADVDPGAPGEHELPGTRDGQLAELARAAGLSDVVAADLTVTIHVAGFDAWWEPFTLGVGPAGDYVAGLSPPHRAALRARCAELVPATPFDARATTWTVRATAG